MRTAVLGLALISVGFAGAQKLTPPGLSEAARALLVRLGSSEINIRAGALDQIASSPKLLQSKSFGRAMAAVLAADTDPFSVSSRIRRGGLSEDWAEFDARLADMLRTNYGFRDPLIATALVRSPYIPQSAFAADIAKQGALVLPQVRSLYALGGPVVKAQAVGVFGFMLRGQRDKRLLHPVTASQSADIMAMVLSAVRDKNVAVRSAAVQALGFGGDAGDLPLLRHVAATDPSCAKFPKAMNICWQALQAIQKIEARAKPRPRGAR